MTKENYLTERILIHNKFKTTQLKEQMLKGTIVTML